MRPHALGVGDDRRLPPPFTAPFTDGRPEIIDTSEQDAVFGIVRLVDRPEERDPVRTGWRALIDPKGDASSHLRGHTPVIFWEMTSTATADAAFPLLDNHRHRGNGAIFFGGRS